MSNVLELTQKNFKTEVLDSPSPVLVDFWAEWCVPCQMMAPILDNLALDMAGRVKIAKLNTEAEASGNLAEEYQIQSIPNMKLFKDGRVIGEFVGLRNKDTLQTEIESLIK
jgi:thioredoxin 1